MLVVEDDEATREFLRSALQAAAYAVAPVADGTSALSFLEHDIPDAIVLDLELPSLHGRDVYAELKALGLAVRVPVIIVTGTNEVLPKEEFPVILRKPVDSDAICGAVKQAIRAASQPPVL